MINSLIKIKCISLCSETNSQAAEIFSLYISFNKRKMPPH